MKRKTGKITVRQLIALLALLAGILSLVFGIQSFAGGAVREPYDARQGVVMVQALVTDGNQMAGGQGTGWAVGTPGEPVEYIVTNGHVVEAAYTLPKAGSQYTGEVRVYFSQAENDSVVAEVVFYSAPEEKDIAVLKLPSPTDKRIPLAIRPSDTVNIGESAWAMGYPGISSDHEQYSSYNMDDVTLTQGVISKRNMPKSSEYEAFQIDTYINHGNSGGPLLDGSGNVIGMTSSGISNSAGDMEGVNYAIISDEVTRVLDSEGIAYTLADGGAFKAGYVLIPAGILLLAGSAFLLVRGRRSGQKTRSAQNVQNGGAKRAILRGMAGSYAGQSFEIPEGGIVLGREASSCNIVFDRNAPGISRRHCRVTYSRAEGCFLLTDLGSTCGTFAGGGKKLAANTPERLNPGDVFCLCDNTNSFAVSLE